MSYPSFSEQGSLVIELHQIDSGGNGVPISEIQTGILGLNAHIRLYENVLCTVVPWEQREGHIRLFTGTHSR